MGSAITAAIGLVTVQWIVAHTRLTEDAAIGAVLGVFFGVGVVLLTVIQTMSSGRQAGLEDFLLGSTAGMLRQDALVIAAGGALALALTWALRRPMTLVSFDADFRDRRGLSGLADRPYDDAGRARRYGYRSEGRGPRPDRGPSDHPAGRGPVLDGIRGPHDLDRRSHWGHFGLCRSRRFGLRAEPADGSDHRAHGGRRLRRVAPVRAGSRRGCSVHPATPVQRRGCITGRAFWRSPGRSRSGRPSP